jgi:uncharacterized protein YgiM (DUF1202 family)
MQTRKLFLFLLFLAVNLACLSTTEPFATYPADTPISSGATMTPAATVMPSSSASPTESGDAACAVISADEALHLRAKASETSQSLAFMERGEVVELINSTNAEWWRIKRGELVGYARSKYLEKSECGS